MVDQAEIHRMAQSEDVGERRISVDELRYNFAVLSDKEQAWSDLYSLAQDRDFDVLVGAADALGAAFPHIPEKHREQAWSDLIRLMHKGMFVGWRAADALGAAFPHIPEKHREQAWSDLHNMIHEKDENVQWGITDLLGTVFPHIPEKHREQAWTDLHSLTHEKDGYVRSKAADALGAAFPHIPEKHREQAWSDLIRLVQDKDIMRLRATDSLGTAFLNIPEKHREQAWSDLIKLTHEKDDYVKRGASYSLGVAFPHIPEKYKEQAWSDLHSLTHEKDKHVRWGITDLLGTVFPHIPEKHKDQGWDDLVYLTQDENGIVKRSAAGALGTALSHVTNKEKAWNDLIRLAKDKSTIVRWSIIETLNISFSQVHDKEKAWQDLHLLAQDKDSDVRWNAALVIGSVFSDIQDKEKAWDDMHRLAKDEDSDARRGAADALGSAFPNIPDKEKAWDDLCNLTQDENIIVRRHATRALGSAFPDIPNKEQAWENLQSLTQDVDSEVRIFAYHSLGRACIFKATMAGNEEEFRNELKKALESFEKSSIEATFFNPAKFCLPFYQAYYALTARKHEGESEIQRYLAEAKSAIEGSESKEKLIEAVENLSNALSEVQRAKDFEKKKCDLNALRQYCERAADLLDGTEKKAPGATKLIKKGLPIINERIKELLNEINKNVNILSDAAIGTEFEKPVDEIFNKTTELLKTENPIKFEKITDGIFYNLRFMAEGLPDRERNFVYDKVENSKEEDLYGKLVAISEITAFIAPHIDMSKIMERIEKKLDEITVSLKPGIREELTITVGAEFLGTGAQHVITIPLQEISYPDLKKDLEKIKDKGVFKLSSLPAKLAEKIKGYLARNKKDELANI